MRQEDKELLLKDISARLPYKVKIHAKYTDTDADTDEIEKDGVLSMVDSDAVIAFAYDDTNYYTYVTIHEIKPYLRPMSSMTEEQKKEYQHITERWMYDASYSIGDSIDWLNKNHFYYRGLIEKGLAIEAPEGMYN